MQYFLTGLDSEERDPEIQGLRSNTFFNDLFSYGFDLLLTVCIRRALCSRDSSAGDHPLRPPLGSTLYPVTDDSSALVSKWWPHITQSRGDRDTACVSMRR